MLQWFTGALEQVERGNSVNLTMSGKMLQSRQAGKANSKNKNKQKDWGIKEHQRVVRQHYVT